jgi:hypothetical protein
MDFMRILKSLEEALYEIVTWLLFYPITMWRSIFHPQAMMRYADAELFDPEREQYTDTLSPPIFLLLTLVIAHLLENHFARLSTSTLPDFLADDKNLIALRAIVFSIFPLLTSLKFLRHRKIAVDRRSLKAPFYSQCYVAAPFAFVVDMALVIGRLHHPTTTAIAWALFISALVWYLAVETRWFKDALEMSLGKAIWTAVFLIVQVMFLVILIALAVALVIVSKH